MLTMPFSKSRRARQLSRSSSRARRLCHEPLEDRRLLSLVVGGFDDIRGGENSIPLSVYRAQARASLVDNFDDVSFRSFTNLTSEAVSGVDILMLDVGTGHNTHIVPLSSAEQQVLSDFVLAGGAAVLLPDNSTFGGSTTPATNESLIDPFGMDVDGTWKYRRIATVTDPTASPVTDGRFGQVTSFSQYYAGSITNLGPYATSLATNAGGDALAVIERGAIGPGSGPVVIYSDANTFIDDNNAGFFPENEVLFLNTVDFCLPGLASISGSVFVDVNENGLYEANEPGIDGVTIELLDAAGSSVLDTAVTGDGGFYLFADLNPGTYQLREIQPSGVADGAEILGSLGGSIVADDTMQLTLNRTDASDYVFAELGQEVTSGDTATIGFWQNKHGQQLISEGGADLAAWLTFNFGNVFGNTFSDGMGDDGAEVATFFKDQLFRQKSGKPAGPAKVDAQFMGVALATYFTSSDLAGSVAVSYGFNVTQTGIGTRVVNVGSNGAAFDVADNTDVTIMQLLLATNGLTAVPNGISGFAHIYDTNGDGVVDAGEAALRAMANEMYSAINEQGD